MAFKTISQDEMDDCIVRTYKANEMDLYVHQINKDRFETMLPSLIDGAWKTKVEKLLEDTDSRIAEVQSVLTATDSQLPETSKITASLVRLAAAEA